MNGKFFTFPLCVLAMPLDEKQILMHMVSHSLERAGGGDGGGEIDSKRIREYVIEHENIGYSQSARHDQLIRGAIITNVKLGWINTTISECDAVNRFVREHKRKRGKDPLVFIAAGNCFGHAMMKTRIFRFGNFQRRARSIPLSDSKRLP